MPLACVVPELKVDHGQTDGRTDKAITIVLLKTFYVLTRGLKALMLINTYIFHIRSFKTQLIWNYWASFTIGYLYGEV